MYPAFKKALPPYQPGQQRPPLLNLLNQQFQYLQQEVSPLGAWLFGWVRRMGRPPCIASCVVRADAYRLHATAARPLPSRWCRAGMSG